MSCERRYVKVLFDENDGVYNKLYTYEDRTAQGLQLGDRVIVDGAGRETTAIVVRVNTPLDIPQYRVKAVKGVMAWENAKLKAAPYNMDMCGHRSGLTPEEARALDSRVRVLVQDEVQKQLRERAVKRARQIVRADGRV